MSMDNLNPVQLARLVERLRAQREIGRTQGGGTITTDGNGQTIMAQSWGNEPIMALVNPDGPEAATVITTLSTRVEALTQGRDEARGQLSRIDEEYGLEQVEICQLEDECAALEARAIAAEAAAARLQQGTTHAD